MLSVFYKHIRFNPSPKIRLKCGTYYKLNFVTTSAVIACYLRVHVTCHPEIRRKFQIYFVVPEKNSSVLSYMQPSDKIKCAL